MMRRYWLAGNPMHCTACGAELRLMQSELDNTTMVPSDEYRAFLCEACDRSRLVSPESALPPTEPESVHSAPPAPLHSAESASAPTTPPTLVLSEDDLDECEILLIPNPIDQNPRAHWRSPMDMMRQG